MSREPRVYCQYYCQGEYHILVFEPGTNKCWWDSQLPEKLEEGDKLYDNPYQFDRDYNTRLKYDGSFKEESFLRLHSGDPMHDDEQNADDYQIGGTHYKDAPVQPWEVMESVLTHEEFIGFLKGNIIKYSQRQKGDAAKQQEDGEKCRHYRRKLKEVVANG